MSKFGWSYPAGCSGTPFDEPDPPCCICGRDVDDCICPECQECGETGRLKCYETGGCSGNGPRMVRSAVQIASLREAEARWAADAKALEQQEADHIDGYDRDDLGESPDY